MAFFRDIRHGLRTLRRVPGLVAVGVITLALGIGANTAIFSVIYSVLLKPLAFPEADRVVQVWMAFPDRGLDRTSWSHGNFWDARDMVQAFEELGAIEFGSVNLTGVGDPEKLESARVNAGFFHVVGVKPAAGRVLHPGEDAPGQDANIVMLSHRFWVRRFGSDPGIVGRAIAIDGVGHEVIGVLPAGTPFLDWADVFRPLVRTANAQRGSWELAGMARMKPGVTLEAARADLVRVTTELARRYPETNRGMSGAVVPVGEVVAGDTTRRALWVLLGAVGFLLLIACVNLTNLLLAKAAGRTREIAIRAALGASRRRVAGLLVAESLLLSLGGAVLGLLLSVWTVDLLRTSQASGIPRLDEIAINGWVLGFTTLVALVTGIVTGLVPALQSSRRDLVPALREGERGVAGTPRQQRLRAALVAAEVALTLALLVGAGLLLRSFSALWHVDAGFDAERRVLAELTLPRQYSDADDGARARQVTLDFESRVRNLPGVVSVGLVSGRPMSASSTGMGIVAAERPDERDIPWASWRLISRDYFRAMGVPLLSGRPFDEQDLIARPWRIIVSQRLANLLWPGGEAAGRQAILWRGQGDERAEVIGVAGDMRERGLAQPPTLAVYLPVYGSGMNQVHYVIHASTPISALAPMLRATLSNIDPTLPLSQIQTLEEIVVRSTASRRVTLVLLSAFAAIALALALAGIFGVTSYAVSRQTAEIGVRVALGASHQRVLCAIVLQGMKPVAAGIGLGLGAALLLSRLVESLLFGVSVRDPVTYLGVAALLAATALLACVVPARQALRVDVVTALRAE
ncbi:MAG TPA: ABC transporter permease [Vicinamibacterales bacterium]|nr:ABC transporter permease [Vicinamibacterales bacterium]